MSTIVAIGGGELKELETLPIDDAIVKLSRKKNPRVIFIPTASNDSFEYWQDFQSVYGRKLGCKTDVLFLIRENPSRRQIEEKLFSSDIVYVGGGNTLRMLRVWKKYGLDRLLRKAYKKGTILSGLSAGAIAWFRYGSSYSRRLMENGNPVDSFSRVSSLGFFPLTISPHHIRENNPRDLGIREIMKRTPGVALALDDNAAIFIEDGRYRIVRSRQGVGIAKVFQKKGKIEKIPLKEYGVIEELFIKG